ncbi:MAG TPA: hypothetical protein VGA72_10070 [Anaerolineales bacterium]
MNRRSILIIINRIAKLLPFLAPFIEKVTAVLLARIESADDIIKRRLQVDAPVQPKKSEPSGNNVLLNKKQDSVEDKTGVVPPPKKEDVDRVPPTATQREPEPINASASVPAQEIALKQIEQDFQDSRERKARMLRNINSQESTVFRLMIIFSVVSLFFIIWGGYIMFQSGLNVLAILVEIVGLLGGAGSLILRRLQEGLKEKAASIERQQDEQTRYLRAIQTALSLTGPEREKQLAETAKWLRDRAGINN